MCSISAKAQTITQRSKLYKSCTYLIVALLQLNDPEFEQFILLTQLVALPKQIFLSLHQIIDSLGKLRSLLLSLRCLKKKRKTNH